MYLATVLLTLIIEVLNRSSSFDIRMQPSYSKYASYTTKSQGVCIGYSYASKLGQMVGNAYGIQVGQKFEASSQQIIQCMKSETDKCHYNTLQNVQAAIDYISKQGITSSSCYSSQIVAGVCSRKCTDGSEYPIQIISSLQKLDSTSQMLNVLSNSQDTVTFVVYKELDSNNYYSYTNPILKETGVIYGYNVAQVVGWRDNGKTLIAHMGYGKGWGFDGYAYLPADSNLIVNAYSLRHKQFLTEQQE